MILETLHLAQFRSYNQKTYNLNHLTTVLVGNNGIGKTNVLEAIYLLATGVSFKADKIEEMIHWDQEIGHVTGIITHKIQDTRYKIQTNNIYQATNNDEVTELRVTLTRGMYMGKRVQKRSFRVNGVPRRNAEFAGNLTAVVFRPEDVSLLTGSPSRRRAFLDGVLTQVDREYARALGSYEKGLRRRNHLLDLIKERELDRRSLTFWDQLLIKEGNIITEARRSFIDTINALVLFGRKTIVVYNPSLISEKRLEQYSQAEVAAGYTLVGPHRDDFLLSESGKDLAVYGSRGEQRMGVLWLKMVELAYIDQKTGVRPLLLLDDVFSELDHAHDQMVMDLLGKQQTIITTTEIDQRFTKDDVEMVRLEDL